MVGLALALVSQQPAEAALSYIQGDLVVGFRATGGIGASTSYLVNIGGGNPAPPETYTGNTYALLAPGTVQVLGVSGIGADLASLYSGGGVDWYNRSDLSWGIFGADTNLGVQVFASAASPSSPYLPLTTTEKNSARAAIASVTGALLSLNPTSNNGVGTFQANSASDASSYSKQVSGSPDFGAPGWAIEDNFGSGTANAGLDLYKIYPTGTGNATVKVGSFSISNAGVITFTAAAVVPEPSRAMLAFAAASLVCLRRRRPLRAA